MNQKNVMPKIDLGFQPDIIIIICYKIMMKKYLNKMLSFNRYLKQPTTKPIVIDICILVLK